MKKIESCRDYPRLKEVLTTEQLQELNKILIHYVDSRYSTSDYIERYGHSDIIGWYEGCIDTDEFIDWCQDYFESEENGI